MMSPRSAEEDAKLDAMQRSWQSKRGLASVLFDDMAETELLNEVSPVAYASPNPKASYSIPQVAPSTSKTDKAEGHQAWETVPEHHVAHRSIEVPKSLTLDAATLGDFPARYTICAVEPHQMPAIGVYIDKRITPGFKYRVRPLPQIGQKPTVNKCLFNEEPLTLKSIGRGYARRFTFEAPPNKLNDNDNYFWSDNRIEGYAFELELISEGDKFTIFDASREAQGFLEIVHVEGPQYEISNVSSKQTIEKKASVRFTGKVEFYETGVASYMPMVGTVIARKYRHKATADVVKVTNVVIKRHRYTLSPGVQMVHRRVTVRGADINDVPTQYSMHGLERFEIPVVGTYVDPRIIPGFHYKVRPNDRREQLFGGRALKLQSIGMGYAKRLTFEPDSLNNPDNYFWSDNHPDGLGLEIHAIRKNMSFMIQHEGEMIGEATVFRADKPQVEEKMEKIKTESGKFAVQKYIYIDVMCHVRLNSNYCTNEEQLMRVSGTAVVRKEPYTNDAYVVRVENVGLDSQLNILFTQNQIEVTFFPKK